MVERSGDAKKTWEVFFHVDDKSIASRFSYNVGVNVVELRGNKWQFAGHISTNGNSVSVLLEKKPLKKDVDNKMEDLDGEKTSDQTKEEKEEDKDGDSGYNSDDSNSVSRGFLFFLTSFSHSIVLTMKKR